jgi:hypothetical protein
LRLDRSHTPRKGESWADGVPSPKSGMALRSPRSLR